MPDETASASPPPPDPQLDIGGILTGWIDDGKDTQEVVRLNRHPYGGVSAHVRVGTLLVQVLADRAGSIEIDVIDSVDGTGGGPERALLHWAHRARG
jgi:hypothetical protein